MNMVSMVTIGPSWETIGPLYTEEGANWPHFRKSYIQLCVFTSVSSVFCSLVVARFAVSDSYVLKVSYHNYYENMISMACIFLNLPLGHVPSTYEMSYCQALSYIPTEAS